MIFRDKTPGKMLYYLGSHHFPLNPRSRTPFLATLHFEVLKWFYIKNQSQTMSMIFENVTKNFKHKP